MRFLFKAKDGGPESLVYGYWLFESKNFGSIVLLCFLQGSRESYHTHAFNAVSWILKGKLREVFIDGIERFLIPSIFPLYTPREHFHRVFGESTKTWVLSFRGPWVSSWKEWLPNLNKIIILTHGRKEVKD